MALQMLWPRVTGFDNCFLNWVILLNVHPLSFVIMSGQHICQAIWYIIKGLNILKLTCISCGTKYLFVMSSFYMCPSPASTQIYIYKGSPFCSVRRLPQQLEHLPLSRLRGGGVSASLYTSCNNISRMLPCMLRHAPSVVFDLFYRI
jgi:hypothetical protein